MDNLTHTLFALTLARTPLRRLGRGTTAALVLSSNAPDIDIVAATRGAASYLAWHRGPTHGPLAIVGLGALVACLAFVGARFGRKKSRAATWMALAAVSGLGVTTHVLMDLPTVYGTRLLSPFDWRWFAIDWMPIVDIYLLVVLAGGLWLGRRSDRAATWSAVAVLLCVGANYGLRAGAHARAVEAAQQWLPPRCAGADATRYIDRWPAGPPHNAAAPDTNCLSDLAALPSFTSPFKWTIVARSANQYDTTDLDLWTAEERPMDPPRFTALPPAPHAERFRTGRMDSTAAIFLDFARFPTETSNTDGSTSRIAWRDVRFLTPPVERGRALPDMFAAWVQLDANERIVAEGLGR